MQLMAFFEKLQKTAKLLIVYILVAVVGYLNYLSGWEIDFSLFYLLPLALSLWLFDLRIGIITGIICLAAWFWIDMALIHKYSSEFIHYWNTSIRLVFILIFTILLNTIKLSHERERMLARTDNLTGVANSRYFYELFELEVARSKRYQHPFSLAYMDLDNFKMVNDHFGHTTGDKALIVIINHIKESIRKSDVVGRLGGDEFAVLFSETDHNSVRTIITNMQNSLLLIMEQNHWPITFSIGVLTCASSYPDTDKIISKADELMYTVKNTSKNAVKYLVI